MKPATPRRAMPHGCLYLNNTGDRWITDDMRFVLVLPDGTRKIRRADYFYSFGNFAGISYRYRGVRSNALPKAADGSETHDPKATGTAALPHIFHVPQPFKRLATLTPEEDAAWCKAFEFYKSENLSDRGADLRAWGDVQDQFPRLLKFDGCTPTTKGETDAKG